MSRYHTKKLNVQHYIADLSSLQPLLKSALTSEDLDIPDDQPDARKVTVVPARNSIMLSVAYGLAVSLGFDYVAYAAHHRDYQNYPDCRPEYKDAMEKALQLGTDSQVKILAPFINFDKSEIVRIGQKLNVPYEMTWSCYRGEDVHCGTCPSCVERKRAFELAGVNDPTKYRR